jgi:hypothetical protein
MALAVYVVRLLIPMLDYGSPFGIWLPSKEQKSSHGGLKIVDFPFHFNFVQKVWQYETTVSSGTSIYSAENHLKVTSDWAGQKVGSSLHFGYSPTMLWIFAPLVNFSPPTAYFLFNAAGLAAIFWLTRPIRCRWGIGLLSCFSPLAQLCFVLGQTSFVTGAGLLYIAEKTKDDSTAHGWRESIIPGTILWALTAKPPLALSAAAVLLSMRRWRVLSIAAISTFFSTAIISPWLGSNWMNDYIHLLRSYNLTDAGSVFAWSIYPEFMANLRALLNIDIGFADNVAGYISTIVWLVVLAFIVILGLRRRLSVAALWAMSILSYLLFCPHVGPTEELLILVILSLCVSAREGLSWQELVLFIMLPLLVFISPAPGTLYGIRLPLFLAQLVLFLFIFVSGREKTLTADKLSGNMVPR